VIDVREKLKQRARPAGTLEKSSRREPEMKLKEKPADCDTGDCGDCNHVCADHKKDVAQPSEALRAKVLSYKHPKLIRRIARDHCLDPLSAHTCFKQMLEYLYKAATTPGKIPGPNVAADKAWHTFLLYSKDYREFCQGMFGFFIDHQPRD
jgi:hypothetical protein